MNTEKSMAGREVRAEATFAPVASPPTEAPQRRAHARYSVDLDVSLGSDHNFYAGFTENLSEGGVFVATHLIKPVGERLELTIHLPDSDAVIRGVGEVRWLRAYSEQSNVPPGMGVRFLDLEPGSLEAIEGFLKQREPMFFDE